MLKVLLATLVITFTYSSSVPPLKNCDILLTMNTCYGNAGGGMVCMWSVNSGCNQVVPTDPEAFCDVYNSPSDCTANVNCFWDGSDDMTCLAHSSFAAQLQYTADCSTKPATQSGCVGLTTYGQQCGYNAKTGTCNTGFYGDINFRCGAYDAVGCTQSECMYSATHGCIGRNSFNVPGGYEAEETEAHEVEETEAGEAHEVEEVEGAEAHEVEEVEGAEAHEVEEYEAPGTSLQKPHDSTTTDENEEYYYLTSAFLGVVFGAAAVVSWYKCSSKGRTTTYSIDLDRALVV